MNIRLSIKQQRIIAIAVVILACLWFFWFRHYLDRQKFVRMGVAMQTLSQRLSDNYDTRVLSSLDFCRQNTEKFGGGEVMCGTSKILEANNIDRDSLVNLIVSQNDLVSQQLDAGSFELSYPRSMICNIRLIQKQDLEIPTDLSRSNKEDSMSFQCSDLATRAHYPLAK